MWRRERPGQGEERASGPGAPRPSIEADGKTKWREGEPPPLPGHRPSRPPEERPGSAEPPGRALALAQPGPPGPLTGGWRRDRVCQQPGLSLWVPFQNAATAVTNLYKESVDVHQRSFDVGIQIGYQRRNKDVLAWVKKRRRTIRREDLISFLCGKVPPPRNSRAPPRLTVVSPNRATSTETSSSVETDLQPFREAIALHGLSGAMASISVRSSTPGSPTHVSSGSNASRRRNGLHDVDLNTFISEEMALHLDNGGTRKRTSAQCGDVITDSPTHKRNRMI
ncbi:HUWE1-associated protein modifying stress responses 1 isoform X1 [Buteo buteo]|uniref:HUWE1-associated protein modifying stress responses 1 isoform X1 n=1 Tax=Buteo buteo TaxID=30397 RepID=UPI003EB91A6D